MKQFKIHSKKKFADDIYQSMDIHGDPTDVFEPDEMITNLTSIVVDVSCSGSCGKKVPMLLHLQCNQGFTKLELVKRIFKKRLADGDCYHRYLELIIEDKPAKFRVFLGS